MSFLSLNKIFHIGSFLQLCNEKEDERNSQGSTSSTHLKAVRNQAIPCWLQRGSLSYGVWKAWGCGVCLLVFHLSDEERAHCAHNKRLYPCQWQDWNTQWSITHLRVFPVSLLQQRLFYFISNLVSGYWNLSVFPNQLNLFALCHLGHQITFYFTVAKPK